VVVRGSGSIPPASAMAKQKKGFEARFRAFHTANPHVYAELVRLCRQARRKGHGKIGIRMLWEVTRWNLTIATKDPSSNLKLNDHYHSRYARLIMKQEPDLKSMFNLRALSTH